MLGYLDSPTRKEGRAGRGGRDRETGLRMPSFLFDILEVNKITLLQDRRKHSLIDMLSSFIFSKTPFIVILILQIKKLRLREVQKPASIWNVIMITLHPQILTTAA